MCCDNVEKRKMTEYWLISAPGEKTCQQTWETMNNVTSRQNNLSVNYKFHIPDLKVSIIYLIPLFINTKLSNKIIDIYFISDKI